MLLEKLQGLGRHAVHAAIELAVHAAEEVVYQQRDIVDPLAERRDADREHVEPVEEVLAEAAGRGQRFQVLVGGGDEADVGVDRRVAADALELLLLQQPQQLRLRGGRHVADFVHEDGSAVGLLELADAAAVGAGERAALVAEKLAFQQRLGNRRAVDGQKRGPAAAAVLVDCPRHHFLAGAAFAENQHGHVLRGDPPDGLVELLHGRRVADQLIAFHLRRPARSSYMAGVRLIWLRWMARATTSRSCPRSKRLEQVVEGPEFHGLDGRLRGPVGGDDDHRHAGVDLADLAVGLQARHVGQADVEDHGVGRLAADRVESFAPRCRP